MIEVYEGQDEQNPKHRIQSDIDLKDHTISVTQIYDNIYRAVFSQSDEWSQGDYESVMYVYLSAGDIWMNCGMIPPSEDIRIWTKDIRNDTVRAPLVEVLSSRLKLNWNIRTSRWSKRVSFRARSQAFTKLMRVMTRKMRPERRKIEISGTSSKQC